MGAKGRAGILFAAGILTVTLAFPAYGAKQKPIKSIDLEIRAEIQADTDFGDETIEIETDSSKYSVDGYDILNDDFEWREDSVPRIQITLTANDDYYFQSLSKDKVSLKGGAEFISAKRENSSSTLLVEVELQGLNTILSDLQEVTLSDEGMASWKTIPGAGSYEARIYRDGKAIGAVLTSETGSVNCRERMQKGNASYTVKVRPVSRFDDGGKGNWVESPSVYITEERASSFRNNPQAAVGEWVFSQEAGKWWYSKDDGTYPVNSWFEVGDKWYFFDQEGYMSVGWILWEGKEYYCAEDGHMLSDCLTPDSYWVGADGAKIAQ